jgi:uncharacterized membrane protein YgcG
MRSLTRTFVLAAAAALAVPAMASAAAPSAKRGVIVQRDAKGGAVVVATKSGSLLRVKLAKPNHLAMGSLVRVSGSKISVVGHSRTAKLRGTVVRRSRHSFALAGNGSVLAVASTSPPAAGQVVSTTVQVTSNSLSDDDGFQVESNQAPSAEIRGTVLSQDATTLHLTVYGFPPTGLALALGTVQVPTLPVGTPVEARVALGPDQAGTGIVLTLVSLRVENGQNGQNGDHQHGSCVKAEGQVTNVQDATDTAPGTITVADENGDVTFIIPAGFGPTGVVVGDEVDAKGTAGATPTDQPTLTRLESSGDNGGSGNDNGGSGGDNNNWSGGNGSDNGGQSGDSGNNN